jgi:3-isopropylmalate dehydrogenase
MQGSIAVLPGDGVGPEVVGAALAVLRETGRRFGHDFQCTQALIGGCAIDATGDPLPRPTLDLCLGADAVLLGAVGGPKWSDPLAPVRPEQGLLAIRQALGLYANLRPVTVNAGLESASTLRPEVIHGVDLVIVRELTGGLYFGKPQERRVTSAGREAVDTLFYTEQEIARLMHVAFQLARQRSRPGRQPRVTSADKANVLATSRLWREVAHEVARNYPDVTLEDQLVDSCAMALVRRPTDFDVIATENTFGDILSDEASMLAGSMGMLPSASLAGLRGTGDACGGHGGLYEPIHGSAPDIAGKDVANPLATILTVALMLELAFGLKEEAAAVRAAVDRTLDEGYRTPDIMQPGKRAVGTRAMAAAVVEQLGGGSDLSHPPTPSLP